MSVFQFTFDFLNKIWNIQISQTLYEHRYVFRGHSLE